MAKSITLEQRMGVNPFGKMIEVDRKPEVVQEVEKPAVDEKIEQMFEQYQKSIERIKKTFSNYTSFSIDCEPLKPTQIELLLHKIINDAPIEQAKDSVTGRFLSYIIQQSYNSGFNDFTISTQDMPIDSIGDFLNGTEKNPLAINIYGNTGIGCGRGSQYINLTANGTVGSGFGNISQNSIYNISGNAGFKFGEDSNHCNYSVSGFVESIGAWSKCCNYTFFGKINSNERFYAKDCIYKVQLQATFNQLIKQVVNNNEIQLIDPNGKKIDEVIK